METSASRIPAIFASVMAMVIIVVGSVAVIGYSQFLANPRQTTSSSHPPGNSVLLNDTNLPTFTTTQTSGFRTPAPQYLPNTPPVGLLTYDNMPFAGFQGSYCWPPVGSGKTDCAYLAVNSAAFPVVAVYPSPDVTFSSTYWRGLQGFSIRLYTGNSSNPIFSGQPSGGHAGGFPLNVTSGSYLLAVYDYYGGGAEVSTYYNVTVVSSPSARIDAGLGVSLGSPAVHYSCVHTPNATGCGPQWEDWPVTVYSNITTSVDLSAASVIYGDWVQFVPSHLTGVGPAGVTTHMLIAGAVRPFVNNDVSNVSLIIRATGENGALGQMLLPLEGDGPVAALGSSAPADNILGQQHPVWVFQGQTNYGFYNLVYDPGGAPSSATLSVSLYILGMTNGSGVSAVPNWLTLSVETPSIILPAYQPVYLEISATAATNAPVSSYAFLMKAVIDGEVSYFVVPFDVMYPIRSAPPVISSTP